MVDESTKIMRTVTVSNPNLNNPAAWTTEGLTPTNAGRNLAIVIPVPLEKTYRQQIAARGGDPNYEVGNLVSVTRRENNRVYGVVIGKVAVSPFPATIDPWEMLKDKKGPVMHDEIQNGLLAKVFACRHLDRPFAHPDRLAAMPRQWHHNAMLLNDELEGNFASDDAVQMGEVDWILS